MNHLVKEGGSIDLVQLKVGQVLSLETSLDTAFIPAVKGHVAIGILTDFSDSFSASVLGKLAFLQNDGNPENGMVWFLDMKRAMVSWSSVLRQRPLPG